MKTCEHEYLAEKYTVQEYRSAYLGEYKWEPVIVNVDMVLLFCRKCGDRIDPEVKGDK